MHKLDLHTHSKASPDGSLKLEDYRKMLSGGLDMIAITDHDTIAFAQIARSKLGSSIIIGEEISTTEGDIIGLYLNKLVQPGMTAAKTAEAIHAQNALVYIPHPFETVRKGLALATLDTIANSVDIIEGYNGRALLQNRSNRAREWATQHNKAIAASSDAHGLRGWGNTYSVVSALPARETLIQLLQQKTTRLNTKTVGWLGAVYPKLNRLRDHS